MKDFPACAVCGGTSKLEVHHKVPFYIDSARELDPSNLITLCESKKSGMNCHLFVGHLGNYLFANQHVDEDVEFLRNRFFQRADIFKEPIMSEAK